MSIETFIDLTYVIEEKFLLTFLNLQNFEEDLVKQKDDISSLLFAYLNEEPIESVQNE